MICPHCHGTIGEQDRYLMSADADAEPPAWVLRGARWFVLFVAVLAVLMLAHG